MRVRHYTILCILFICFLCMGILVASSGNCQFSGLTLTPPNTAVGYGGLFNPYVFWPGVGLKAAAASNPLVPFLPFGYNNFGSDNILGSLLQLTDNFLNPIFGFGGLGLGLSSPLSGLSLLGNNFLNPFQSLTPFSGFSTGISASFGTVSPIRTAAQSGTWTGTWTSTYVAFPVLFNTGPMMLNIVEDPLLGTIVGTTILQGSRYASALTEVAGVIVNNVITLEGFLFTGFDIGLTCYLTSPATMNGFYTVYGTHTPILDEGVFSLTLSPAVL